MEKRNSHFWKWKKQVSEGTEPSGDGNAGVERVLQLYGTIAEESWFDDDITPALFRSELFADEGPITIYINSPGGDSIAASQIYTMLMDYPHEVTIKIDGIAESAASVIAMAGTKVLMAPTALLMIHNPATVACGDHEDMQKAIEMLNEVKESIINAYEIKTNLSRAKISRLMDEETWMDARKAIELGFADGMLEDEKKAAPETEAYTFSEHAAVTALVNKLSAKTKTVPAKPDSSVSASDTRSEPAGRSVEDLRARLAIIKNYL